MLLLVTLKAAIIEQISELPLTIHYVKEHEELIKEAQSDQYWRDSDEASLDELVETLAPVMKFRDRNLWNSKPVYLNLTDTIHSKEMVAFGPEQEAVSISKYRKMVESLIFELVKSNPILQKIQAGREINKSEAELLAETLHEKHPHITEDLLRTVYKNRKAQFIQFIRHILGLETLKSFPETVSEAFNHFIKQHTDLSTRQLEFLNLLKNVMIDREKIERKDLINTPFTIIHPKGIRGVFSPKEIEEILTLTEQLAA